MVPRYRSFFKSPISVLTKLFKSTLLTSTFITGSIGTAWATCCLFQKILPGGVLPKGRFWLSGVIGGLWAFVDSRGGRGNFLYSFRLGLISAWKVLVKKGLVRGIKFVPSSPLPTDGGIMLLTCLDRNGDVYLFVCSLALINSLFDIDAHSVSGSAARRALSSVRGLGMKDPVTEPKKTQQKTTETKVKGEKGKERAI